MKAKYKVIFSFVLILAILCFIVINLVPVTAKAEKVFANESGSQIVSNDAINIYFSKTDIDKSAGSKGELKTATYLSEFLQSQGCDYYASDNSFLHEFTIGYAQTSNNVIGVKKSSEETNVSILIGAHYDNSYASNKCLGAIDNASGVVALMGLIEKLKGYEFKFNIIYCFFGANEIGLNGSKAFVNSLSKENKENLKLSIILDGIGAGEHTYYYAGDSANSFMKTFNFEKYSISSLPTYSKNAFFLTNENLAYSSSGLKSDNVPFLNEKIKSISFFSGNLNSINAGYKESENNENIGGSELDTPTNFSKYYPEHIDKINNVSNAILDCLTNSELIANLNQSYNEIDFSFINNKFMILAIGVFGVLLLCGIKTKNAKAEIEEENK